MAAGIKLFKIEISKVSGKNLTEFFNDWFTGQGHPTYTVRWSQNKKNWAKITVSQITSHPSVSFFEMPLALKFKSSAQEKTVIVNNTKDHQVFWEEVGFKADTVIIDPDYWVLLRNNVSIKEPDLTGPDNEIRVYPVPATSDNVILSIKNPVEKTMMVRLYNAAGQMITKQQINTPGRDEEIQINISKLSAGVYLLRIDAGDFKTTRHIMKK